MNIVTEKIRNSASIKDSALKNAEVVEIQVECNKCKKKHDLFAKFLKKPEIDIDLKKKGKISIIEADKLTCSCGFVIDLLGIRNDIENQTGKKIV